MTRSLDGTQLIQVENAALHARIRELENELEEARGHKQSSDKAEIESMYRAIGESIQYGIWICDAEGKNIYASDSFLNLVGLTQEEYSSFGWGNILHPDEAANTIAAWMQCVNSDEKWEREHRVLSKDGEWHHILARGIPIKNAQGKINFWAGINLNINALKVAQSQLFESNQRLNALMEAIPIGVSYSDDVTSDHITGNSTVLRQFEITRKENLSASAPESEAPIKKVVFLKNGRQIPPNELPLQRAIAEKAPIQPFELEIVLPSGRHWFAEVSGAPVYDVHGRVIGGIAITVDVTSKKQKEDELVQAYNKLESMISSITDGFVIIDANWNFTFFNQQGLDIIGYSREEVIGFNVWDIFPMAVEGKFYKLFNQAVDSQTVVAFEEYYPEPLNKWVECHCYPSDEGLAVYFRDITDRKRSEAMRQEIADRYEQQSKIFNAMLSSLTDFVYIFDLRGRFLYANTPLLNLWGLELQEAIGKDFFDLNYPLDLATKLQNQIQQVIETRCSLTDETPYTSPTGSEGYYEYIFSPIVTADGTVEKVVGSTHDVTERKKAEATLRANENRFRKVFNHAATGIAVTRMDGQFEECNPAYCKLLGYTSEELRKLAFQDLIHPQDAEKNLTQILLLQKEEIPYFSIENRYVCRDGKTVWVHKFVSMLRNEIGEPAHLLALVTDITERRATELHLLEIGRRKDEFLAMLGHELRNPLAAIRYAIQMLKKLPEDLTTREFANDVIDRQSSQLARMVDDLLDVARIDQGRIDLKLETLNLNSLFDRAADGVRTLIEQKKQSLSTEFSGNALWVSGDAARLEQVIGNLLTNAAKYTPEGGAIHVATRCTDSEAIVSVKDNGVGISEELLPHIFDLFRQAEGPLDRSHGGLGIGLTVAKSLVEMHRGRLVAQSDGPGLGSCFSICIPLLHDPTKKRIPIVEQLDSGAISKAVRVLIVDDHVDTAKALARILLRRNYEVSITHDGLDAIRLAEEYCPEVFLLDLGLPGTDGYDIAYTIRKNPLFKNSLLIAISGYAQESDRQRALTAGFDHHCAKPLDITKLLALISCIKK